MMKERVGKDERDQIMVEEGLEGEAYLFEFELDKAPSENDKIKRCYTRQIKCL